MEIAVRSLTGRVKEKEADQQSRQTGYGDANRAEDEEAMQEDNTNSAAVASERSEEMERGVVGGRDVRHNAKELCVHGRPCVEDSMGCGEKILGDTNAKVEWQPLLR